MCGQNYANMEHRGPPLGIESKPNEKRLQCTVGKFVHFYAVVIVICIFFLKSFYCYNEYE